jgi:hypothetical protein
VVLRGEGEVSLPLLLEAVADGASGLVSVPGAITLHGDGPPPVFVQSLDDLSPARILEPGVFLVDDVAFIQSKHGFAIGAEIERRNLKKEL